MLRDDAVVDSVQPGFHIGENQVDDGQEFLAHLRVAALRHGEMIVAKRFKFAVAGPIVGDDPCPILDGACDEAALLNCKTCAVRDRVA